MFAGSVMLALLLPVLALPAMTVLVVALRHRRLRAGLCILAMALIGLSQLREALYALGCFSAFDPAPSPLLQLARATEGYLWQILGLAALAIAALSWPLPPSRWLRWLAIILCASLLLTAALLRALQGLRFN